jgi:hypothetical protein
MSRDLATFVVEEAIKSSCSYCVGLEGHDISTMAFFYPYTMNVVTLGRHQQFWVGTALPGTTADNSTNRSIASLPSPPVNTAALDSTSADPADHRQKVIDSKPQRRGPLVLVGIFSTEYPGSSILRERILSLFELRNDSRVCAFSDFRQWPATQRHQSPCEFVYTFVMGAVHYNYTDTFYPTEITGSNKRPLEVNRTDSNASENTIYLNIRENMNEGKSQTWLNFAAHVADEFGIEYVIKSDEDNIFDLPRYFQFTSDRLPVAPYNKGIYAGRAFGLGPHKIMNCKLYRDTDPYSIGYPTESKKRSCAWEIDAFIDEYFDKVHFYMIGTTLEQGRGIQARMLLTYSFLDYSLLGNMYLVSTDVAKLVGREANHSRWHDEDILISSYIFRLPEPLTSIFIFSEEHKFMHHPIKLQHERKFNQIRAAQAAEIAAEKEAAAAAAASALELQAQSTDSSRSAA